jgi:hypothetical protein
MTRLKNLLDYLNNIHSMVTVEHFDRESGIIKLSNSRSFNIDDLKEIKDVEMYLTPEQSQPEEKYMAY